MKSDAVLLSGTGFITILVAGFLLAPFVFVGRVIPGLYVGTYNMGGIAFEQLTGALTTYNQALGNQEIRLFLRDQEEVKRLKDLNINLDVEKTARLLTARSVAARSIMPIYMAPLFIDNDIITRHSLETDFAARLVLPRNATLVLNPNDQFVLSPGRAGEQINVTTLRQQISQEFLPAHNNFSFLLLVNDAPPPVEDSEVGAAKAIGDVVVQQGIHLSFNDQVFEMKPFTVKRLLTFQEQTDPQNPTNSMLGATLNPQGFKDYITTTIAPQINQEAVNARFDVQDADGLPRVSQFALPQVGRSIDLTATTNNLLTALAAGKNTADIAVAIVNPDITAETNINALGIQKLLTTGETDFHGSPKNRIHNITVGASRYQGILIPPNTEFSFLSYLGPVDGEHGFKPELVIKNNVTTPEFGGGLCQVSTTTFRAAVQAGLKISERHNHSYAVRYYGTPGFDATIYPPYTDLRFLNNTPGYILIQTKVEGTKLKFEFWGSEDGRQVAITGPSPYNRQSSGAVKATLQQKVTASDGNVLIEDTFRSNYKSPALFPHVLAANREAPPVTPPITNEPVQVTTTPTPTN